MSTSSPTPTPKLWTGTQLLSAVERAGLAALGAFTGALVVTNTSVTGLQHSAIAAGIAAAVAFLSKLGSLLPSQ